MGFDKHTELQLLEAIEDAPETSQADLAASVGVAVGTVNWYLKRWSGKGIVKVKRISRWKWRYLLTPKGMSEKAHLAASYLEWSMKLYRLTRDDAKQLLREVKDRDFHQVVIIGEGDIADICRLTCLELALKVSTNTTEPLPILTVDGRKLEITWPETEKPASEYQSRVEQ